MNEHLTKDHRGEYFCSYYKACLDCEYYNDCPCLDQIRAENDRRSGRDTDMTLTQEQMNKALEEAPPKDVGEVDFDCPNCGASIHKTIYEYAWEVDEDGDITYDGPMATAICKCGASLFVAWQPDGEAELYWTNKKKMQTCSDTATKEKKE